MRGMNPFAKLWGRRTSLILEDGLSCNLMSLPDLVQAKKTQLDKDWPMIRRLLEAHYFEHRARPGRAQVGFWLKELRTPELLAEVARHHPRPCHGMIPARPLLADALAGDVSKIAQALVEEEMKERARHRQYWSPLRQELESLRRSCKVR
jgi:hypothetical protein